MIKSWPYSSYSSGGKQTPNPFHLKGARRQWLNVLKKKRLWPLFSFKTLGFDYWKPDISWVLKFYYPAGVSPFKLKWTGISLGKFPTEVGLLAEKWNTAPAIKKQTHAVNTKKKKKNLFEFNLENELSAEFLRFIIIESPEPNCSYFS